MSAGEFLQPWTAQTTGPPKDYSENKNYAVGVNIIVEWVADFTNATITLWQDNKPGDAQGGPSVNLESNNSIDFRPQRFRVLKQLQHPTTKQHGAGKCPTRD